MAKLEFFDKYMLFMLISATLLFGIMVALDALNLIGATAIVSLFVIASNSLYSNQISKDIAELKK